MLTLTKLSLALVFTTSLCSCETLPDPLTCNPEDPLCQKAELREQRRIKRAERPKCPEGYTEFNINNTVSCVDPFEAERAMEALQRGFRW